MKGLLDLSKGFLILVAILLSGCSDKTAQHSQQLKLVNLAHLNHLYQDVVIDGKEMAIIHIYSQYPDYEWVDANNEGIACVDDAARAAVVYLRHFEITGDSNSVARARRLLEFCCHMQAEDGLFYNFILADHTINRQGKTSFKSLGWWAARGIWALGEGYRVFHERDPPYANILRDHILKIYTHLDTLLAHYPEVEVIDGFNAPKWLLYNSAADATSELMLGLAAYAEASGDSTACSYLQTFAEGLLEMQMGDESTFPFGLHLSWKNIWHGWANSQTQALAQTSMVVQNEKFKRAAISEASHFYPWWIKKRFPREITFVKTDSVKAEKIMQYDQIAYAIRPGVLGCLRLHELTSEKNFAELAAELATWFFGNNPARQQMYDAETGRCFDGILSETEINRNSGAESTIEALYAILEIEANPIAWETLTTLLD